MSDENASDIEQESPSPIRCSVSTECSASIDIILRSSDGVSFGTHTEYLGRFSDGFPAAGMTATSPNINPECVDLDEQADVVKLLLQFMHPERPPSSESWSDDLIIRFSNAVEKYIVFGAMEVCRLRMRDIAAKNSLQVFLYAIKYGDAVFRNYVAPMTLREDMDTIRNVLLEARMEYTSAFIAWVRLKDMNAKLANSYNAFGLSAVQLDTIHKERARMQNTKFEDLYLEERKVRG